MALASIEAIMELTTSLRRLIRYLACSALISCTFFVQLSFGRGADGGTAGNADAVTCTNLLAEQSQAQFSGGKSFQPKNLSIYPQIQPVLDVASQLPDFENKFVSALNKPWKFSTEGIQNCPTNRLYTAPGTLTKVACQWDDHIVIDPMWYFTITAASAQDCAQSDLRVLVEKQKATFIHELILGVTLGTQISADAQDKLYNVLTQSTPATKIELQRVLEANGFGVFGVDAVKQPVTATTIPSQFTVIATGNGDDKPLLTRASYKLDQACPDGWLLQNKTCASFLDSGFGLDDNVTCTGICVSSNP